MTELLGAVASGQTPSHCDHIDREVIVTEWIDSNRKISEAPVTCISNGEDGW